MRIASSERAAGNAHRTHHPQRNSVRCSSILITNCFHTLQCVTTYVWFVGNFACALCWDGLRRSHIPCSDRSNPLHLNFIFAAVHLLCGRISPRAPPPRPSNQNNAKECADDETHFTPNRLRQPANPPKTHKKCVFSLRHGAIVSLVVVGVCLGLWLGILLRFSWASVSVIN